MKASEEFGKTSKEARQAWELVEELDASNSHHKKGDIHVKAEEKVVAAVEPAAPPKPTVHVDTAEAVKHALEASKIYGKTSQEARIAWDIVEELDAANSRHNRSDIHVKKDVPPPVASTPAPSAPSKDLPTDVESAIAAALLSSKIYGKTSSEARMAWELVEEMDSATSHHKKGDIHVKAEEKVVVEEVPEPVKESVAHKDTSDAIKAALEASNTFGKTSKEARVAWELVEEIDSANAHHKTTGSG